MNLMALGESMLKDDVSLNNNCDIEAWKRKKKKLFHFPFLLSQGQAQEPQLRGKIWRVLSKKKKSKN